MKPARRRAAALVLLRLGFALIVYTVAALLYRTGFAGRPGLLAALVATVAVAVLLHLAEGRLGLLADRRRLRQARPRVNAWCAAC